jgi:hypothetical protein
MPRGPGESFLRAHWVAVPKALRARRVNSDSRPCGAFSEAGPFFHPTEMHGITMQEGPDGNSDAIPTYWFWCAAAACTHACKPHRRRTRWSMGVGGDRGIDQNKN